MKKIILSIVILGIIIVSTIPYKSIPQSKTTREEYLKLIKQAEEELLKNYDSDIETWKKNYIPTRYFGYGSPFAPITLAKVEAFLYSVTKNKEYAERAKKIMTSYADFRKLYPEEYSKERSDYKGNIPPITSFFQYAHYIRAYLQIKDSGVLNSDDVKKIEDIIAKSSEYVVLYHEWGPHNRAILRAEGLLLASQALPNHPNAGTWANLAKRIADSSWAKWSIEDAQVYLPIWLASIVRYAESSGQKRLFDHVATRYYFDYFVQLMCPAGFVTDFGDSHGFWSLWTMYLGCFEKGAAAYKDPCMKFAAERIFKAGMKHFGTKTTGADLIDAYNWCDDTITAEAPQNKSSEVLEDIIGKKIAFRSGWGDQDTFMLLNYRDEGDYGLVPRDYLRYTIPVEGEKMHHGHADENSICMLMHKGSVLLHDSGYGNTMTNRIFGADMYHNRIVARASISPKEQPILQFLRDELIRHCKGEFYEGVHYYKKVTTEKIHFYTFKDLDVSRTRLTDKNTGYQWDRVIVYLKAQPAFAVFDFVKILKNGDFTFSNLWFTKIILNGGSKEEWFDTKIDKIAEWKETGDQHLLIYFPQTEGKYIGADNLHRSHQLETCINQNVSKSYKQDDMISFATILVPHDKSLNPKDVISKITYLTSDGGASVEFKLDKTRLLICCRYDLDQELVKENIRPRYIYEKGRVKYGEIETDARFAFCKFDDNNVHYGFIESTKMLLNGKEIFASQKVPVYTVQPDGKWQRDGVQKWEVWEETKTIK